MCVGNWYHARRKRWSNNSPPTKDSSVYRHLDQVILIKRGEVLNVFSFRKFWLYCWGIIFKPTSTLKQLAAEPSLAYGFAAYFLFGLLYGLFSLVVYFYGHLPRGILVNFIPQKHTTYG